MRFHVRLSRAVDADDFEQQPDSFEVHRHPWLNQMGVDVILYHFRRQAGIAVPVVEEEWFPPRGERANRAVR
jgi:hypothetical protein